VLVYNAIRNCNGKYGSFDAAMALFDAYLETFTSGAAPVVEMVAIDCVDSPSARIKMYLRTSVDTLAKAKDMYTLGGRLSGDSVDAGLKALGELWPILFRLDGSDIENSRVLPDGSYCGYAIEMKPGSAEPEIKIHIPVRKIAGTDAQLCASLSTWFKQRGHGEFAAAYKDNLAAAL
jgi:DMATS type aromatic prenyltransferase